MHFLAISSTWAKKRGTPNAKSLPGYDAGSEDRDAKVQFHSTTLRKGRVFQLAGTGYTRTWYALR